MTIYQILLAIQYASIALMMFMCAYITKNWKKPVHGWLFFYSMATLVNSAGYLAIMLARTESEAILATQLSYLGRVWIPFSIFKFLLLLCSEKSYRKITSVAALLHAGTYFLVLTLTQNNLYYKSYQFVNEGIFPHLVHTNGIIHHFYDLLILAEIIIGITLLFYTIHLQKNRHKRIQFSFVLAAIITDSLFYVLQMLKIIPGYDITALGYTLATIFFYIAIFKCDMLGAKEIARDMVLELVSDGVIVTDTEGTIVDFNKKARSLLPNLESEPQKTVSLLRTLIQNKKTVDFEELKYTPKENVMLSGSKVAGNIFMLTDDTVHYRHAEKLTREMMIALSKTVDAKDHYTNGHSQRVAKYSKEIARRLGKSEEEQEKIYEMGLLHDIGKIGVSEEIINKTSRLTDEEFAQIKTHTTKGYEILYEISAMPELAVGARNHHERFDGKGYPDGLAGNAIPEAARIICVADCYDAMTSTRTYSTPKPQEVVRAEFERCSGSQFDPAIARIMISMIDDDREYKMNERGMSISST